MRGCLVNKEVTLSIPFQTVILCEKPNQARVFKSAFKLTRVKKMGDTNAAFYDRDGGLCVVYLSGHLLELMPPQYYAPSLNRDKKGWNLEDLPVIPPGSRWKLSPKFDSRPKERKRIQGLLGGIKWALVDQGAPGEIVIAVDNDKEGELLGWETLEYFGVVNHPNISRALYSQINDAAMKKAFDDRTSGQEWFTRYLAGLARQYADWLVGMNITMALTVENSEFIPPYTTLNSGRVVFAICYLLYLRYEAMRTYVPKNYYSEHVRFKTDKEGEFYLGKVKYPSKYLDPELKQLMDKGMADRIHDYIVKEGAGEVVLYEQDKKKKGPPVGFHRTGFDRHMIRKFGMDLDVIAKSLQTLYDGKGLITYPRVDVKNLDVGMHAEMPESLAAMAKNISTASQLTEQEQKLYSRAFEIADAEKKSKIWKKGIAEGESHHAIIPTAQTADISALTRNEFLVYREIVDRLLIQFLPDYEYSSTTIETKVGQLICKTTGSTPLKQGWKGLSQDMEEEKPEDEQTGTLPILTLGQKVGIKSSETKTSVTKEPKPYTTDELLGDLENPKKYVDNAELMKRIKKLQIGTDGTRQDHVTGLATKGFVQLQARKGSKKIKELVPTRKLVSLMGIAPGYFKYPETSAYWEDASNEIQAGNLTLEKFLAQQAKLIHRFFDDLKQGKFKLKGPVTSNYKTCPEGGCGGYVFFRKLPKKKFDLWACAKCDSAYFDEDGKLGGKMGGAPSGGGKPKTDWVPPKGTPKQKCTACNKDYAYHKKIPNKDWSIWECLGCKAAFFDKKGELGNQMKKKK